MTSTDTIALSAEDLRALRELSDDDLTAWQCAEDTEVSAAARAERTRRDREARMGAARRSLDTIRHDAECAVHAQVLAASDYTRGRMLSRAGVAAGVAERDLWRLPWDRAVRFMAEELTDYFQFVQPRITVASYVRARAAETRAARIQALDRADLTRKETITDGHDHDRTEGPRLAGDEPGALRRDPATTPGAEDGGGPGTVRPGGHSRDRDEVPPQQAAGADGRPGGPVQRDMNGCRHPHRIGTPGQCGNCPAKLTRGEPMGIAGEVARGAARVAEQGTREAGRAARMAGYRAQGEARAAERRAGAETALGAARTGTVALPDGRALVRQPAEPIRGDWLLNLTDSWMAKHCYLPDAARHAAVLYVAAQHFRLADESRRLAWPRFGRILLVAAEPGSGKTTTMVIMGHLCGPYFFGIDANPTAPGLCMTIAQEHAAVFIDECHRLVGSRGTRKADVVTIINAGYEKNGTYLNGRGGKANRVPVYAPVVMAAKKDPFLTSAGEEIADLIDRCAAVIEMHKPPAGTELAEITDQTEAEGALIAAKLGQWAAQQMADPARFREAFTDACDTAKEIGLTGRAKDIWAPLLATAAFASPGHLDAACDAAVEFQLRRAAPVDEAADPLKDLEASLMDEGAFASWGGGSFAEFASKDADPLAGVGSDEDE